MPNSSDEKSSMMEELKLETREEGKATVITMKGATDPSNITNLEDLFSKLRNEGVQFYILDLSETRLINSHQIGVIVRHVQLITEKNQGGFAFVKPSDRVRYLLEITCVNDITQIYDTVDEAVQNLAPSP